MKKNFGFLAAAALAATAALLFAVVPAAYACPTPTVQAASSCTTGAGTSGNGTICVNDTTPYSLAALESGTQTLQAIVNGHNATYLITNDTANTNFSLTFTGAAPSGSTQYLQCSNGLPSGLCQITGSAGTVIEGANYGPPSGGWPSSIVAQIAYNNVPVGSNFDITFPNFVGDHFTGSLSGACYGSCQTAPPGNCTTTVTGTVYVPNGQDPLPDSLVYIPTTVPSAIPAGVQCLVAGNEATGNPITFVRSNYDGSFTLTGVPSGTNIPIVIQSGKWRMQGTIPVVTACATQAAPKWATTMPSTHVQGDIPKIALVTGSVDATECVLLKSGLAQSEFTDPSGSGQINFYKGSGNNGKAGGVTLDATTPTENDLLSGASNALPLNDYDMLMFPCQGAQYNQQPDDLASVLDWANRGGRVFSTHFSYVWLYDNYNAATVDQGNGPLSLVTADGPATAAAWHINWSNPAPDPGKATVDTSFVAGATLSSWLETSAVGGSTTPQGQAADISIDTLRLDQNGVLGATQSWLTLDKNTTNQTGATPEPANPVMQFTFNTPVGAAPQYQCGKVLYNDYHVYDYSSNSTYGKTFPSECPSGSGLTPQQHLLEYALFDLTNAITPVSATTASQTYINTPSTFTQGDNNDSIAITVTNSGNIALNNTLQVTGTLPTGVTINTGATFTSGGWSCTPSAGGSAFTCTRGTSLAVGDSDVITLPVAVAGDAPLGTGGSLISTISGGGMTTDVVGVDQLTIVGSPESIGWPATTPITYGTPAGSQLNASLSSGSGPIDATCTYAYGSTPVTSTTILPAGTYALTATCVPKNTSLYTTKTVNQTLVVNPAVLTVTANNASRAYGVANPAFSDIITGFVNNDQPSVVSGSASLSTVAITTSPVGTYAITAALGNLSASNYTFQFVPGVLTVTQPAETINWPVTSPITYGTTLSNELNASVTAAGSTVPGVCTYKNGNSVLSSSTVLPVGSYTLTVTCVPTDTTDYTTQTTTANLTVQPAVLTVTADNQTKVYGAANPTLTYTINPAGLVNGDTLSVVSGAGALSTTVTTNSAAGSYPNSITVAQGTLAAANYTFTYAPGNFTVTSATGVINWPNPAAIIYGTPLSGTQLDATATCNGQSIPGTYVYTPASGVLNAGSHALSVVFTPTGNSNCTFTQTSVPLTVIRAALTVVADNKSMTFGTPVPALTGTLTGVVNGDAITASYSTTGSSTTPAGTYPITATLNANPAVLANYTVTNTPGVLTIVAPLSLACPAVRTGTVGVPFNSGPMPVSGGTAPYTFSYLGTLPAGLTLNTSTGALTGTPAAPGTYGTFLLRVTDANGVWLQSSCTMNIDPAPGVITWPVPAAITYGTPLSGTQLDASATCLGQTEPGTYTYTPASGVLSAGSQTLSVVFTPTGNSNCTYSPVSVPLTVNKAHLTVVANNQTMTYGMTVPALTGTLTGVVNNDNITASYSTTGSTTTPAGSYPISATLNANPAVLANYTVTNTPGVLTINAPLSVACAAVTVGEVGVAFSSGPITITGGTAPYTYSIVGTLPAGLTLNTANGAITGLPITSGIFVVQVTDSDGATATGCAIAINGPLTVACATFTSGSVGVAFNSGPLTVAGGVAPYTFSIVGTLPDGLTLNPVTGAVSGIATLSNTFSVMVTDFLGVSVTACPITISASCSLGVANAYNLISLTGDISDAADINGRIAAAGQVTQSTTIGTALRTSDPIYSLATANGGPWAIIAAGGIPTSNSFNVNAGGNVYSSTATSANFNFANENYSGSLYAGSSLVIGGPSPIDFPTLQTEMYSLSEQLTGLSANGVACSVNNSGSIVAVGGCPSHPIHFNPNSQSYNPSWIVLYGTSPTTNVFNITPAEFENNNNLDIEVPTGSTAIINVAGTSDTLQRDIYFQGNTVSDVNASNILFNFATATSVTMNGQIDATVLAPYASLTGGSQMGGVFIAASIGSTGEVHYGAFGGSIPNSIACSNNPAQLFISCPTVNIGRAGVAFNSGPMAVTGGTAPYTFSVVGTLPAGLALNTTTGAVAGTATASGTFSVKVTDANSATSTSCPITINPAQAQTPTVSMTFTNTQWTYPGEANITACIAPATSVAATGTVQILDGSTVLTTVPLQGDGCAYWYITPGLNAGAHVLTASYSGDGNNSAGVSPASTIQVAYAPMTMEASCWNTPYPYGANFQCNANTDSGPKSGYMTYSYDGGTPVVLPLNSNGATAWSINLPPVGTHTLLIAYPQQGNYTGATLPIKTFVVTAAPVNLALTPSTWSPKVLASVTFTASVSSSSAGAPTVGSVSFYDGSTLLGTVAVNGSGVATYSTSNLTVGSHSIKATYANGVNYGTGTNTITLNVASLGTVATPAISPAGGTFTSAQTVTITDTTAGATIYYTTNGSAPTTGSSKYTGPITVSSTQTVKALAVANGYSNSGIATATYTINASVAAPGIAPNGGTFTSAQTVTITAAAGATIRYTTDGSTPTASSPVYTGAITVSATKTIKAIAISGSTSSPVASAKFTINLTVATPTFSVAPGTYTSVQTVAIADATAGATIRYTTDGSTPTASSPAYSSPITVSATKTIKAIAVLSGYANSAVASAKYTINLPAASTPGFSLAAGTYKGAQSVSIVDTTPAATIYYTVNGTTPTTSSTVFAGAITVSATETVKAIAVAPGYSTSAVGSAKYTIK